MPELGDIIDLADPASHCNQDHDHNSPPWPYDQCDWQGLLLWSMSDTGFNEGAAVGVAIALQYGLGVPEEWGQLAGDAVANVWPRRDMMRFAIDVPKTGNVIQGVSLAVASQWHNCHAFTCLAVHAPEVGAWLLNQ